MTPRAWRSGWRRSKEGWTPTGWAPFFERGESGASAEEYLRVLEGWTLGAAGGLSEASRTLFSFLCCLEEPDRLHQILQANWADLWKRLARGEQTPDLEAALPPKTVDRQAPIGG